MYMKGSPISFATKDGHWQSGIIEDIKKDSIFYKELIVRQIPTQWGVTRLDTTISFMYKIHFNDIEGFPRVKESFGFVKNGNLFMIGAAGYTALNLINAGYLRYAPLGTDNRGNLITAAGVFGVGFLLHKLHRPLLYLGKKYTLHYVMLRE